VQLSNGHCVDMCVVKFDYLDVCIESCYCCG